MRRTKSCWTAVDLLSSRHFFRSRSRLRSSRSLSRRPHSEPQVRSDSRSQFRRYQQQKLRRTKSCWTAVGLLSSRCFFRSRRARPPLPPVCHMLSISAAAESLFTVLCNLLHLCGSQHGWPALRCRLFHTIRSAVGTVGTVGCEWVPVLLLGAQLVASGGIRRPLRIAAPFVLDLPSLSSSIASMVDSRGPDSNGRLSFRRRRRGREDTIPGLQIEDY
jgi:hypothetical protein